MKAETRRRFEVSYSSEAQESQMSQHNCVIRVVQLEALSLRQEFKAALSRFWTNLKHIPQLWLLTVWEAGS